MKLSILSLVTAFVVVGCAIADSEVAQQAETGLLGLQQKDLESCLGVPNRKDKFDETTILSYDGTSTNSGGLSLASPVGGGLSLSGGGYCHLTARLDKGRVTSIRYTGETDAALSPKAYCAPLVRSCMARSPSSSPQRIGRTAREASGEPMFR
ncbi:MULTISPECIES: hypothetical protein [Bradyrhizobium]|uniref:hypothetical protein n=1 Tax=Bradyrhizobium elkanii TaxID=29448 RepID=UPI0012BCA2B7|nr:hypothetical protein [Bradyrhizobium elkanii]